MDSRRALQLLFGLILLSMLAITITASGRQPLWEWTGLVSEPDRWWTIATLADAYFGFLTFYAWVFYKETAATARVGWFVAVMLLGNIAMAVYMLIQLARLEDGAPVEQLLLRRTPRPVIA
ncbi:MAG TPA: DUF1475 family protein [Steroidobacteraceae bacterium]|nr:DUF1475 family protein [Steroidobacteraceae bacterium]